MQKTILNKYIFLFFSLLFLTTCEKEDLIIQEPSHQVIFTSEMDFENKVNIGEEISLGDVSAGVESRLWTLPQGIADIIGSDNDVTSTEANIKVVFNTVGDHPVRLQQTFKSPAFVGTRQTESTELDTTIIIRVLDLVQVGMTAHFVNPDGTIGEEVNLSDQAMNDLPASRVIRFTPNVIGEPLNYLFEFEGGDPAVVEGAQEFIDVKYKRLGSYGMSFIASRSRPFGRDTVAFQAFVNVIPSTDPLTADRATEKDGKIAVVFSREVDPTTVTPESFSVNIQNLWNVFTPAVTEAVIDPEEGNVVLLTLDNESVYNDDIVKITYMPGDITSTDGIKADAFEDLELEFPKVNELKGTNFDFSFENSTIDNWTYQEWGEPWDKYSVNFSGDQAFDGSKSLYLELNANGGMIIANETSTGEPITFPVEMGQDYELGLWVYVTDLGNNPPVGLAPDIRIYWQPETDWGIGPNPELNADFPVGEWVYSSAFVKFNDTEAQFMIRGFNSANPEAVKVFVDNVTLSKVRLRP